MFSEDCWNNLHQMSKDKKCETALQAVVGEVWRSTAHPYFERESKRKESGIRSFTVEGKLFILEPQAIMKVNVHLICSTVLLRAIP